MIQRSLVTLKLLLICFIAPYSYALLTGTHRNNGPVNFRLQRTSISSSIRNPIRNGVRNRLEVSQSQSLSRSYSLKASAVNIVQSQYPLIASSSIAAGTTSTRTIAVSNAIRNSPLTNQLIAIVSMSISSITGCLNPSIIGGLLSGGLHAISGPDHLAALLPPSVGKSGWYGLQLGATWGLGHGVSAIFIGLCAFFLKGRMSTQFVVLQKLSKYTEAAVGLSLFVIGAIGIKENLELRKEMEENKNKIINNTDNNSSENESESLSKMNISTFKSSVSIFLNGILHGFSWDGAPSIAPALAMTSWQSALSFLLSYCLGKLSVTTFFHACIYVCVCLPE